MRKTSGRERVLEYLRKHLGEWAHNQELREASGLNDVPRVIRAFRQQGWQIEVRGDGYVRLVSLERQKPRGERKPISRKLRYQILHRDGFRCRACGRSPDNGVKLTIDHIIPVEWGGETEKANLQTHCEECNAGKQAWVKDNPPEIMQQIISQPTVEARIEALFDAFPNQDIPSTMVQLISKGALDWQRALRRIRERTGKKIKPTQGKKAYRYFKE